MARSWRMELMQITLLNHSAFPNSERLFLGIGSPCQDVSHFGHAVRRLKSIGRQFGSMGRVIWRIDQWIRERGAVVHDDCTPKSLSKDCRGNVYFFAATKAWMP